VPGRLSRKGGLPESFTPEQRLNVPRPVYYSKHFNAISQRAVYDKELLEPGHAKDSDVSKIGITETGMPTHQRLCGKK
jgi:hypothetical protein